MTMLAAVTLLPAVLGFAGRNIDKFGLPHRKHAEGDYRESFWYRWSRVIQRRPWPAVIVGLVVLLVLAAPVFSLRLGFSDTGNRPTTDTTRRAYDLLVRGLRPGSNSPFLLVAELPSGAAATWPCSQRLAAAAERDAGRALRLAAAAQRGGRCGAHDRDPRDRRRRTRRPPTWSTTCATR